MKIYAIYCIFTADQKQKENFIVSQSPDSIIFPIKEIEHPRHLHNEIHYNLQNLFKRTTYNPELLKNISFTHIDIQNDLVYKYLDNLNANNVLDINNDIFVLCCAILENRYELETSNHWTNFKFVKSFTDMDCVNSIVDFAIEKSIL
jgi:hypothetical protein